MDSIPFSGRWPGSVVTVRRPRPAGRVWGQRPAFCGSRLLGGNTCERWQPLKAQLHRCRLWDLILSECALICTQQSGLLGQLEMEIFKFQKK